MAPTSKELAMTQKTQEKHRSSETEQVVDDEQLTAAQHAGQAALDSINEDDIDQVLADIDDVLEENAEEFVQSFIQRGGQ
jgi:ubiquitin-like protein Pup